MINIIKYLNNTKTILIILILLAFTALQGSTIEVTIPETQASIGDTLLIPVQADSISKIDSVSSFNCKLVFNPEILNILDIETGGTLAEGAFTSSNITAGEVLIAVAGTTPFSGSGPLVYLKATSLSDGSTDLNWKSFIFNNGTPEANTNDAKFSVTTSSIESNTLIKKHSLEDNYPNPFNSSTILNYKIGEPGFVNISIYNIKGEKIITLKNNFHSTGNYNIRWNALDRTHSKVSSGIYFVKLIIGNFVETRKILYAK